MTTGGRLFGAVTILVAILSLAASFLVPEVRRFFGLDRASPAENHGTTALGPGRGGRQTESTGQAFYDAIWEFGNTPQGMPTFLQFAPTGEVHFRLGPDSPPYNPGNISWYKSGTTIRIIFYEDATKQKIATQVEGTVGSNEITGTISFLTSKQTFGTVLRRITR